MTIISDLDDMFEPVVSALSAHLRTILMGHLIRVYLQGDREVVEWGDVPYEGPPMQQAIKYAEQHCAKLITNMNDETKSRLAQVVSEAIDNKSGIDGLARTLKSEFDHMSKYRAEMIARTETCDALEQAFMDRSEAMGITGKEWVTFDPCEICQANEDEGVVPLDHVFSSGDVRPPAHPNCRCALAPVTLK